MFDPWDRNKAKHDPGRKAKEDAVELRTDRLRAEKEDEGRA